MREVFFLSRRQILVDIYLIILVLYWACVVDSGTADGLHRLASPRRLFGTVYLSMINESRGFRELLTIALHTKSIPAGIGCCSVFRNTRTMALLTASL